MYDFDYINESLSNKELNKNDIIKIIKEAKLPKEEFWLGFGAALVMYGIINKTKDIDAGCSKKLFNELSKKYEVKVSPMGGKMISINKFLDIFLQEKPKIEFISNIQIEDLDSIILFYKKRGREKDKEKIKIIETWRKKNNK